VGDGVKPLCAAASSGTKRAIRAISRRSRVLRYLITFADSLLDGKLYNDCHDLSIRALLESSSRAHLIWKHQSVPFSISGQCQLALVRRIVQSAVIAVLRQ